MNLEEDFWKENAKLKWASKGEKYTRLFHRYAKIKASTKPILVILHNNEAILDPKLIANHVTIHFKYLFNVALTLQYNGLVEETIPSLVDDNAKSLLTLTHIVEEIIGVILSLRKESAPGPNDFGGFFYHTYWDIIKIMSSEL